MEVTEKKWMVLRGVGVGMVDEDRIQRSFEAHKHCIYGIPIYTHSRLTFKLLYGTATMPMRCHLSHVSHRLIVIP